MDKGIKPEKIRTSDFKTYVLNRFFVGSINRIGHVIAGCHKLRVLTL